MDTYEDIYARLESLWRGAAVKGRTPDLFIADRRTFQTYSDGFANLFKPDHPEYFTNAEFIDLTFPGGQVRLHRLYSDNRFLEAVFLSD